MFCFWARRRNFSKALEEEVGGHEESRRGNNKRGRGEILAGGEFLPITANILDGLFISDSHLVDLCRHDYRIGLCIFPCRCTNIKWAIWRLVKRQSANVREDILDSVKQGGKGTEVV